MRAGVKAPVLIFLSISTSEEKMKKTFFMILGILLSVNTLAYAQLKIDKYQERLIVAPGETISGFIIVENVSKEKFMVTATLQDIAYLPPFDGTREFKPAGSMANSLGEWITISPEIFTLNASGKQKVSYTLNVPKQAKGGYYGTIFFENKGLTPEQGVGIVLKMGYTLSVITNNAAKAIKIEDVSLTDEGVQGKVLNSGDIILNATYSYHVIDAKGKIFDRGNVTSAVIVPPGEKAPFDIKIAKKIAAGNYSLVVSFNLAANGGSLIGEVEFTKDNSGNLKIIRVKD